MTQSADRLGVAAPVSAAAASMDGATFTPSDRASDSRVRARHVPRADRIALLWTYLRRAPEALASVVVIAVVLCALVPQWLAPYSPTTMDNLAALQGPTAAHWLGSDQFGRDVLSMVIYGARQSLWLALTAVLGSCTVGCALGLIAGYAGGFIDTLIMRLIDIWMAIPNILLAIAVCTALGSNLGTLILAISLVGVPRFARVLRAQALAIRARPYILAARASGASHSAIITGHILPHCFATILVMATLGVGTAILLGTSLSFLGLGANDEHPDWGYILAQGRGYLTVAWWSVTFPGAAIAALVISVNVLGDALRRRLDPRGTTSV